MAKTTQEKFITRSDLTRSFVACYKLEDEIWVQLRAHKLTIDSPAIRVLPVLNSLTDKRPAWCDEAAWTCMVHVFAKWCNTYGNLARFQELRRTKEKAAPIVVQSEVDIAS